MKKKIFFLIIVILAGMFFLARATKLTKEQTSKDLTFVNEVMKPAVHFVKDFYEKNSTLPAESDFYKAKLKCAGAVDIEKENSTFQDKYYKDFETEIIIPKGEYILWIWRGEWAELYYSYTNKMYVNGTIYEVD